jgi:hypothetical protein
VTHFGSFDLKIGSRVLINAQGVDPKETHIEPVAQLSCSDNGVLE